MTAGIDRQAQVLIRKAAEDECVLLLEGTPDGPFGFHVQQAIEKLLKHFCAKDTYSSNLLTIWTISFSCSNPKARFCRNPH